jgi:mannosyltransferase OCH1-like enzyme
MQLSQIYISDDNQAMGEVLKANAKMAMQSMPGLKYRIYNDHEIKELLSSSFSSDALTAYNSLAPYSYKSDFARFCILHELGGWYIDIGLRLTGAKITVPDNVSLLAFRDVNRYTRTSYACAGGAIYATPRHPATAKAIELIIENVKSHYYGVTPLCPTGPTLWGRAIAATGVDASYVFGDFLELTPLHSKKNKAMVLPDGTIFAFNKQSEGGDLERLGAKGTNNYNHFWHNKSVYITN